MRMRRKPWARPELDACGFYIKDAPSLIGHWHEGFARKQPLHIELGCGKGGFIAATAAENKDINYIAIDIKSEVLVLAKRNIEREFSFADTPIDNIKLFSFDIARIGMVFSEEDTAERIYINFPNPWPKECHKKRRLTHPRQLESYRAFLKYGGHVLFKTDDDELFGDSLEYFETAGFSVVSCIDDLYENGIPDGAAVTEHERMFYDAGLKIHFIEAVKDARGNTAKATEE